MDFMTFILVLHALFLGLGLCALVSIPFFLWKPALRKFVPVSLLVFVPCALVFTWNREFMSFWFTETTASERRASFDPYRNRMPGLTNMENYLRNRTALLVAVKEAAISKGVFEEVLLSNASAFATATKITPDGYVLTAGHCVEKGEVCFMRTREKDGPDKATFHFHRLRPVQCWEKADIALLHAAEVSGAFFELGDVRSIAIGDPLLGAGLFVPGRGSGADGLTVDFSAGQCRGLDGFGAWKSEFRGPSFSSNTGAPGWMDVFKVGHSTYAQISSDLLTRPGGSGGPTLTLDLKLVGIHTSAFGHPRPWLGALRLSHPPPVSISAMVEKEVLVNAIAEDRKRQGQGISMKRAQGHEVI